MAHTHDFIPDAPDGGTRLDVYLARALGALSLSDNDPASGISRARLQDLIAQGAVAVSGAQVRASHRVRPGQAIRLDLPDPVAASVTPVPMAFDVLYEDGHLLVLNKPAHLVTHPGAGTKEPTLVHGLLAHCEDLSGIGGVLRPGIVHRLDRGTSGVLLVAKNDRSHRHLAAQFAERTVHKGYMALVWGVPPAAGDMPAGGCTIDTPYGRDPKHRHKMTGRLADETGAKRARTQWRVVGEDGKLALLAVTLHTGRTHQIRVHLSEMGHPVVGDALYGQSGRPAPAVCPTLDHQALHAAYLAFEHPVTGERMRCRAPIPATWHGVAHTLSQARRS